MVWQPTLAARRVKLTVAGFNMYTFHLIVEGKNQNSLQEPCLRLPDPSSIDLSVEKVHDNSLFKRTSQPERHHKTPTFSPSQLLSSLYPQPIIFHFLHMRRASQVHFLTRQSYYTRPSEQEGKNRTPDFSRISNTQPSF